MKLIYTLLLGLIFSSYTAIAQSSGNATISVDELLKDFNAYTVIDVSKPEKFQEQSILGAKNIGRPEMSDDEADYGGLIASREKMEASLTAIGVSAEDRLVLYDHKGGSDAARLWWVLHYYGHTEVQILDGGIKAWGDRNSEIDTVYASVDSIAYSFTSTTENKSLYIGLDEVKKALDDPNTIIVDTRNQAEYEGTMQKDGAFRAGRIPESVHIDWAANVDYHGTQLFLSETELLNLYASKGVTKDKQIICYCHSGVRSSNSTFVLTQMLGYENVKNFDGSWIEWSYHSELPLDTGRVEDIYVPSYSDVFWTSFKDFGSYTWNEITFNVSPKYVNYFWLLIVLSLVVWGLEILFPWRKNQPIIRKDFWMDAFFMFFNFYIFKLVIFLAFSNVTAKFFHDIIGGDATSFSLLDMSSFPLWGQLIIFFLATDFIQWFTHVLLHRFDVLWRFHKVHHSVEQMGFAAHLRYHWMENIFYTPMKYIMVMLIGGFTPEMAYIVFYISIAIGHLNHANIGLSYGPFKYLLNNPKMHIWHHAKELPHERRYGVNFGISLSIWDYIFRKNYIPSDGKDIPLGFPNMERYPKGFFGLIFSGFGKTPDEKEPPVSE